MNWLTKFLLVIFLLPFSHRLQADDSRWITEKKKNYSLHYTAAEAANKNDYLQLIDQGMQSVKLFFKLPYKKEFDVYLYPDRSSLDSTWQSDWKMPDFRSECWMVASGIAQKLDLLAPATWDTASCEHTYLDKIKTQQLITHELVHVFHGQYNISPDFSNTAGIDWFVEGLATYASGQCDAARLGEVKGAIDNGTTPATLDEFWSGKLKYGLSGSMVQFIDQQYGRAQLISLMQYNNKRELLQALHITEIELILHWTAYMKNR